MTNIAICLEKLTKTYNLYLRPRDRLLDSFGLLPKRFRNFEQHMALNGIDLKISKAEKVALIGRNGSGKSTMLKLISGVSEPTSGRVHVDGQVRALLQVGTGFHTEFTGRQNVEAYLAQFGTADSSLVREIIDFAELEDYIDQPLRTYSTGMAMRLMFSASTAVSPEILLLDEVLNVGDAYFAQKSLERMERLVKQQQMTLILVTHDIYAATKICDRFVWIDKGKILMDGDAKTVIERYEVFNRDLSEHRIRQHRLREICGDGHGTAGVAPLQAVLRTSEPQDAPSPRLLYAHIKIKGGKPIDEAMPIDKINFLDGDRSAALLCPGRDAETENATLLLNDTEHNWSEVVYVDGIAARSFQPWGSIYHAAPFFVSASDVGIASLTEQIDLEVSFKDTTPDPCVIEIFDFKNNQKWRGELGNKGAGGWLSKRVSLQATGRVDPMPSGVHRFGSQDMTVQKVEILDENEDEKAVFRVGAAIRMCMSYRINRPGFKQKPVIHISFLRDGTQRAVRWILNGYCFDYEERPEGELILDVPRLLLGPGHYMINIVVMSEGGYDPEAPKLFFTSNPLILDHHSRGYEIEVLPSGDVLLDDVASYVAGKWCVDGDAIQSIMPEPEENREF